MHKMRTTIDLAEDLVLEAMKLTRMKTKRTDSKHICFTWKFPFENFFVV